MGYDRNDVLSRTRLPDLCDEILGPRRGRGPSASWPCPDPGHGPQTGQTPPVTVFQTRGGTERWRCHACGAGGTAVDLVMRTDGIGFREALDRLGRRIGAPEAILAQVVPLRPPAPSSVDQGGLPGPRCLRQLLRSMAVGSRRTSLPQVPPRRGLADDVLRANRVGADPGPRAIPRADGLPRGAGPPSCCRCSTTAAEPLTFRPATSSPVPAEVRQPGQPARARIPSSRRGAPPRPRRTGDVALVCEGIPDALTAAQAGWRSVAVLGAGLPDERVARGGHRTVPERDAGRRLRQRPPRRRRSRTPEPTARRAGRAPRP